MSRPALISALRLLRHRRKLRAGDPRAIRAQAIYDALSGADWDRIYTAAQSSPSFSPPCDGMRGQLAPAASFTGGGGFFEAVHNCGAIMPTPPACDQTGRNHSDRGPACAPARAGSTRSAGGVPNAPGAYGGAA